MTDLLALLVLLAIVAAFFAIWSGNPVAWLLREIRLARAETWQGEHLVNPELGNANDPRVAAMVARQKHLGERMRRQGRHIYERVDYVPELSKPVAPPPKYAAKVIPILSVKHH